MKRIAVSAFASLVVVFAAFAGEFDEPFTYFYDRADADGPLDAMVFLVESYDATKAAAALIESGFTRAQRHEEIVYALKDQAAVSQEPVLALLDSFGDKVTKVRPFWIANVIEVHATKEVFDALAARADVGRIRAIPEIALVDPVAASPSTSAGKGLEGGVSNSRAPEMWAKGFTGASALACDIDTGADGDHPAFASRWRGLDAGVSSDEAWFDPVTYTTTPFDSANHGSHTLGTMVGDDGAGNQIGMAPDAEWIAAGVIDRVDIATTYADAYAAFEWAADPDDNPSTTDDVPDVVNNSWGLIPYWHNVDPCDDYIWPAIDGAEAAGVVVVFAAGNEGTWGAGSIRVPADRKTSDLNTFSVGAVGQDGQTIAYFSSLGPSGCDGSTIKPEVSAVGVDVRSAYGDGTYGLMSGTSMATPHVAGAVLLLRDAFPEATVTEIKNAIYQSAVDLGATGEDNTFGRGRLDVVEAFHWLCAEGYGDLDGDEYLSPVCDGADCNDDNGDVNPGAVEVCNNFDDNCDGYIDEGGDALCDDGVACNGIETCGGAEGCIAGEDQCPDGEICNAETDECEPVGDDDDDSSDDDSGDDDSGDDDSGDDDSGDDDDDDDACGF